MNMVYFKYTTLLLLIIAFSLYANAILGQSDAPLGNSLSKNSSNKAYANNNNSLTNVEFKSVPCNINSCDAFSKIAVDTVYFDNTSNSINLTNVEFKNVQCNSTNFEIGMDVYVYQLLPDGTRDQSCNVMGQAPDNVLGFTRFKLGNTSFCGYSFVMDTVRIDSNYNFIPCDGAVYDVEMAIYATTNTSFINTNATAYSTLNPTEYEMLSLGTVTANINNVFAGDAQPLLVNNLNLWQGSSNLDTIVVPCNTDVPLFLQAQSIIADCPPYGDYSSAIPSEMSSILVYAENGGFPQLILDPNLGYEGGQQTGTNSLGFCYGGIYTYTPFIFEAQNVAQPCNNGTVTLTLHLQDTYTNQIVSNSIVIKYTNNNNTTFCNPFLQFSDTLYTNNYIAADSIYSSACISVSDTVKLQAAHRIKLTNGFKSGLYFNAEINDCQ